MKFRHELSYDAPPDEVFAMLADPAFRSGGTLTIDAPGKPTSMAGTISLAPVGDGTTEVVELEIKARVPLIGGKLEGLMAQQVRDGMDAEREVGVAWLAGDR